MYIPKYNEEKDVSTLHTLIESHPLGAWAAIVEGDISVNHIPFLLHKKKGELGTLAGHVARANDIWQEFSTEKDSVVIFQGAQTYTSPNWYPSKHEHGKAVPTWSYMVVHAQGIPRKIEDPEWLLQHVNELSDEHEKEQSLPWKVADAPDDFVDMLIRGIVGIEIQITKLIGKWKLNQNRSEPDKLGVVSGLMSVNDSQAHNVADNMAQYLHESVKG